MSDAQTTTVKRGTGTGSQDQTTSIEMSLYNTPCYITGSCCGTPKI